jgi:nucleotide-binding universal stress UspA family protein
MTPVTRPHRAVIVGVDGSEQSLAAVELGAEAALQRHEPLRLIWAYLWPLYASAVHMPGAASFDEPLAAPAEQLETIAVRTRQAHPGLEVSHAVIVGAAANVLIGESVDASLLVVGSRGRGGFAGLLTGSVATQVATHARCPVIVVRQGAAPAPGHPVG